MIKPLPPGLIAAPFTPFTPNGDIALDGYPAYARFLRDNGVVGVFACGTTGEGPSLTVEERMAVTEAWVKTGTRTVVNVGSASAREGAKLADHAAKVGAAAVSTTAPFYFRPPAAKELVAFLAEVAAGAPGLPFYYYDIPSVTGVVLPTAEVVRRATEAIPNFVGIKYSNPDLHTLQECLALGTDVKFGIDECLLAAVALGVTGAVGSTYNYAAPVYRRMLKCWENGDVAGARAEQLRAAKMVRVLIDFGGVRAGKAMMRMAGIDCGPVRPPLRPTTADEERALFDRLRDVADVFARPLHLVGE